MGKVIRNVGTDTSGTRETSDLTNVAGVASRLTTLVTINDEAVIQQFENHGVPVHSIRGDGRAWFTVLESTPGAQTIGDVWLEEDISLGTVLRIRTSAGILTISASGVSGGGLTYTAASALLQGHAIYLDPSDGPLYASALVDSDHVYRVRGLVLADTLITDPVTLVTDGQELSLPDWSLMTGGASLVQGADYWLSDTPGRYTTTPNAAVASQIGYAATANIMVVKTGLIVLP